MEETTTNAVVQIVINTYQSNYNRYAKNLGLPPFDSLPSVGSDNWVLKHMNRLKDFSKVNQNRLGKVQMMPINSMISMLQKIHLLGGGNFSKAKSNVGVSIK